MNIIPATEPMWLVELSKEAGATELDMRRYRIVGWRVDARGTSSSRLHVLLPREGHAINKKRVQRLYREERLTVRRRGGRKRAVGTRRPIATPLAPNQR
jgi:putative transposase